MFTFNEIRPTFLVGLSVSFPIVVEMLSIFKATAFHFPLEDNKEEKSSYFSCESVIYVCLLTKAVLERVHCE